MNKIELDQKIIELREKGKTYQEIQKALGNPSKKYIRSILLSVNPDLIDMDVNSGKLRSTKRISLEEGELRFRCISSNKWNYNLQGENYTFTIKDNVLYLTDSDNFEMKFSDLDSTLQKQFLNEIRDGIN